MIHLYKSPGPRERDGISFDIISVDTLDAGQFLDDGWVMTFEELTQSKSVKAEQDRERFLRDEIERMSGKKAGGRSSIESLEAQYKSLKEKEDDASN